MAAGPSVYLYADRFPLVRDMGRNRVEGAYTHHDRTLDFDVFLFVAEGRMNVIEEGIPYSVGEGEYMLLRRGLHHWGEPFHTPGTTWYWIHFVTRGEEEADFTTQPPLPGLDSYFPDHYAYRTLIPKQSKTASHWLGSRLEDILKLYREAREWGMTRVSVRAYELLMELARNSPPEEASKERHDLVDRVTAYLREAADRDFEADGLARHMKLNYSYLSTRFRRLTGRTPVEVHTKLRMNKAIELMRASSLNVSEISERLGYSNPFYFSRVFKKTLGEAPSVYMSHLYK